MIDGRKHIQEALDIGGRMLLLADQEKEGGEQDGCLELDGVLRDCAFKVQAAAEKRREELGLGAVQKQPGASSGREAASSFGKFGYEPRSH